MAMQTRGGNEIDFDPNKMVEKEIAGTRDTRKVFYAFAPGDVKQLATKEDFQADLNILDANIERAEHAYLAAESLIVNKAGINDTTPTLTEAYSGAKTQSLIDNITIDDLSNEPIVFTQATTDIDIATNDTLTVLFGKILKRFATIATSLANKFNVVNIIHNDTTNDATKVPSSAVTFTLGGEIDTINTILTWQTFTGTTLSYATNDGQYAYLEIPTKNYIAFESGTSGLYILGIYPNGFGGKLALVRKTDGTAPLSASIIMKYLAN